MALIPCRQCGAHISSDAAACPKCGAKPARSSDWGKVGAALIGVVVISSLASALSAVFTPASTTAAAPAAGEAAPAQQPRAAVASTAAPSTGDQWTYRRVTDPMAKADVHQAYVKSSNTQSFGFPYAGEQRATLQVRTHPRYGRDVTFSIEKGQFMCKSYRECTILVKFDDNAPEEFAGVGPEDNSTQHAFIKNGSRFLARMKKAKKVLISTIVYRNGEPAFEFDVSGFDATRLEATK
jgi:RNA polymerase subunit RPABC4/transcription elongation factor Spt4